VLLEIIERRSPTTNRVSVVYRMQCEACNTIHEGPRCRAERLDGKWHFCDVKCYARHKREHSECWPNNVDTMNTPAAKERSAKTIRELAGKGEWQHWLGKRHSLETRQHLSDIAKGGMRAGENNGMHGRRHSDEARTKMSEAKSRAIIAGTFTPHGTRNKKGWHESTKTGRRHFFRSSWEEAVMAKLDTDQAVTAWDYESVRIPYYYGDNKRWHVPDFVVMFADGHREMWEVKPAEFLATDRVMRTTEAAQDYCQVRDMTYMYVTRTVLEDWGIYPMKASPT